MKQNTTTFAEKPEPYFTDQNAKAAKRKTMNNLRALFQAAVLKWPVEVPALTREDIIALYTDPQGLITSKIKEVLPSRKIGAFQVKDDALLSQIEMPDASECFAAVNGINLFMRSNSCEGFERFLQIDGHGDVVVNEPMFEGWLSANHDAFPRNDAEAAIVEEAKKVLNAIVNMAEISRASGEHPSPWSRMLTSPGSPFMEVNGEWFVNPFWVQNATHIRIKTA